jgi:hypothetical protein
MACVLFEYESATRAADGVTYRARACGSESEDGTWQAWIEFLPPRGGKVLLSPRETSQASKLDLLKWASGVTPVYLEGALGRALLRLSTTARVPARDRKTLAADSLLRNHRHT